jgi:hypothetical protein
MHLMPREEPMATEIMIMVTMAAALLLVSAVWADLYVCDGSR